MATDGIVYTTDNFSQSFILGNDGGYVQQQFNHNLRQQIGLGKVVHLNLPSVAAARELLPLLGAGLGRHGVCGRRSSGRLR